MPFMNIKLHIANEAHASHTHKKVWLPQSSFGAQHAESFSPKHNLALQVHKNKMSGSLLKKDQGVHLSYLILFLHRDLYAAFTFHKPKQKNSSFHSNQANYEGNCFVSVIHHLKPCAFIKPVIFLRTRTKIPAQAVTGTHRFAFFHPTSFCQPRMFEFQQVKAFFVLPKQNTKQRHFISPCSGEKRLI